MTDDLVKRLRFGVALDEQGDVSWCNQEAMFKAADRIEKLEDAVRQSSIDIGRMGMACGEVADHIEKLKAALQEIASLNIICASDIAVIALRRTALEGKE